MHLLLGWTAETWTAIGTVGLAVATFVTLFFAEPVRRIAVRTKLTVEVTLGPPDIRLVEQQFLDANGNMVHANQVLYVRLRIVNGQRSTAKEAQVLAATLNRIHPNGTVGPQNTFSALPLSWSHFGGATIDVARGQFRQIDLGFLRESQEGSAEFVVTTVVHSFGVGTNKVIPNILEAGSYDFKLMISAENAKTRSETWRLSFPPTWIGDEARLTAGVSLSRR